MRGEAPEELGSDGWEGMMIRTREGSEAGMSGFEDCRTARPTRLMPHLTFSA
ncbi:MAG: hypothetical protein QXH42_07870 [Thermoplasmata archaeon]